MNDTPHSSEAMQTNLKQFADCDTADLPEISSKAANAKEAKTQDDGYYTYSYEHVANWISCARSYICDASCGMNSKVTNQRLLHSTLELLDLLKNAFKDTKEALSTIEFRINA